MTSQTYKEKNIVVAGGAGFIGSHVCERLLAEGHHIICIDNFVTSQIDNIQHLLQHPKFVFLNHDCSVPIDLNTVPELDKFKVRFQGIQTIFNFACPISVKNFTKYVINTLDANSLVIKNLLEMTRTYGSVFVHGSTSSVYGEPSSDNLYYNEKNVGIVDFTGPRSAYYEGKRFAETMAINYRNVYNLDIKIARIFNTYGPRMSAQSGRLIPELILTALSNKDIVIYGDPKAKQSYCYIDDMVDALIKLSVSEISSPINIGQSIGVSVTETAQLIIGLAGSASELRQGETLPFSTYSVLPDTNMVKNQLGWLPLVTLQDGITRTIEYMRTTLNTVTMSEMVDSLSMNDIK